MSQSKNLILLQDFMSYQSLEFISSNKLFHSQPENGILALMLENSRRWQKQPSAWQAMNVYKRGAKCHSYHPQSVLPHYFQQWTICLLSLDTSRYWHLSKKWTQSMGENKRSEEKESLSMHAIHINLCIQACTKPHTHIYIHTERSTISHCQPEVNSNHRHTLW